MAETKKIATKKTEAKKISTTKTEAKKLSTTKTESKKLGTTKTEPKKLETTKAEPVAKRLTTKKHSGNANIYVQYEGKELDVSKLINKIEGKLKVINNLDIYIKPEDGKAYYVCDERTGSVEL